MGLATYLELKDSIAKWSKRSDILSITDDFIDIAESLIYSNPDASLRIRDMEARAYDTMNTIDRFMPLPDGYVEMRNVKLSLDQGEYTVQYVAPEAMVIRSGESTPCFYTVSSQIEFDCVASDIYEVEFLYYKSLTPLSSSNLTNAILTRFPHVYLYGALFACHDWMKKPEEAAAYYQRFVEAIRGANKLDKDGRYGVAPTIRSIRRGP
jgi:hypothetical protein